MAPNFPVYDQQNQLTSKQSTAFAPKDTESEQLALKAKTAEQAGTAALAMANAYDTIQKTSSQANFQAGMADIQARAAADPDYNNAERYVKEINTLKQESGKGFASGRARAENQMALDLNSRVGEIKIGALFQKKAVEHGQQETIRLIDGFLSDPNPGTHEDIRGLILQQIAAGIFGEEEGNKLYSASVKTLAELDIYNDPSTSEKQSQVLKELQKGDKGAYGYLSTKDRLQMTKDSQTRIFQNNQTYKRDVSDSQMQRANGIIEKINSPEGLTIQDIEAEFAIPEEQGGMKRSTLKTYRKLAITGVKDDLNRLLKEKFPDKQPTPRAKMVKQYLDLVDNFMDSESDQWKAKEMLAEAYQDGIIDSGEQLFLNQLKQGMKDIEWNRSTNPIVGAMRGIQEHFQNQNASDEEIASKMKTLVGGMIGGQSPDLALRAMLTQDMREKLGDFESFPKVGKKFKDGNGNLITVYPDGTYDTGEKAKAK